MKKLILLRHAKSSWGDASRSDFDRPLNARGKSDAPQVGEVLRENGSKPEQVLSSSARRARKTAQKAVASAGWDDVDLQLLDDLYLAPPGVYLAHLQQLSDDLSCVMVVGHNPGMEELLYGLTGRRQHLPTAALVQIQLPISRWRDLNLDQSAEVVWQWSPKEQ